MRVDSLEPQAPPSEWTADHVMLRMIWAFDTLRRMRVRVGPGGYGTGWPAYVHEYADLVAQEENETAESRRRKYQDRDVYLPPGQLEVSLMEEAFAWPAACLDWSPGMTGPRSIVLVKWAWRRSTGQDDVTRGLVEMAHAEAERIARALRGRRVPVR